FPVGETAADALQSRGTGPQNLLQRVGVGTGNPSRGQPVVGSIRPPATSVRLAYGVLTALFAMNLLNYIDRYILNAVLSKVQTTFQLNDQQGGYLTTAFFLSYVFFSPATGWLGDRLPRKYLLAVGVGVWSLATVASGLAGSYGAMLLARAVLGIGEATYANLA